jgi:hypothetical protein
MEATLIEAREMMIGDPMVAAICVNDEARVERNINAPAQDA